MSVIICHVLRLFHSAYFLFLNLFIRFNVNNKDPVAHHRLSWLFSMMLLIVCLFFLCLCMIYSGFKVFLLFSLPCIFIMRTYFALMSCNVSILTLLIFFQRNFLVIWLFVYQILPLKTTLMLEDLLLRWVFLIKNGHCFTVTKWGNEGYVNFL